MTEPVTEQQRVITAQIDGAAHSEGGLAVDLPGEHHSPERIMFVHGAMTGHGVCTCPVVDEHGHNVNPGRAPLDTRALGRAEGSRKASETFARRRARKCADELAIIDPTLWDDETRRIVTTLATLAAPSRIDDVLADELPVTLDELDRLVVRLDADGGTWDDMPDGTEDIRKALAADLIYDMQGAGAPFEPIQTAPRPAPRPYPNPRPRPDPDPRPRPEPHPSPGTLYDESREPLHQRVPVRRHAPGETCLPGEACVHDNGDYRAS